MDINRANEARDMTKKLAALAEKYQCAIVLVGHDRKCTFGYSKSYDGGSKAAGTAAPSVGRKSPRQGAKVAFDGRNGCQKYFCVTFGESNKAYAPYPVLITRTGRKDID